jgi:hypothetical protein
MSANESSEVDQGSHNRQTVPNADTQSPPNNETSVPELRGQLELLEAENRRLRREYVRAQQSNYRRTALGLAVLGVVAIVGGWLFPGTRDVLIALGGSALVAGILTYYLTPTEFVAAAIGEVLADTLQNTYNALQTDLDLQGEPVYVPLTDTGTGDIRLFLPQHYEYTLPDLDELRQTIVVPTDPSQRGVAVRPTGAGLLAEFRTAAVWTPSATDEPDRVFAQLADALVEQFELADQIATTIEDDRRCVLTITGSTYGVAEHIEHPIPSFIVSGAAVAFSVPARVSVRTADEEDFIVECRWDRQEMDTETNTR